MSIYTSTDGADAILPDHVASLITLPAEKASVAFQVSTLIETGSTSTRIPLVSADPAVAWVAEGAEIGTSDPTIDQLEVVPTKLAGVTIVSNEMASDSSPAAQQLIGDGLARDFARKIDTAFFGAHGADAVRQHGLEDVTGFTAVTGPAAWANVDPFEEAISNADGLGLQVNYFVANPADALLLAKLKVQSGSNLPLLGSDPTAPTRKQLAGVPLLVSSGVTAGTIWGIPSVRSIIVRRTDVSLAVDHSQYFTSDRTAIRATMRLGFGFPHKAALQKIKLTEES